MNILHVVSGLAPDQRFGGISRVALDLARQQQRQGDHVHILSSDVGFSGKRPRAIDGVRVTLLRSLHVIPALGFGTIVSAGLPVAMARLLCGADLVHVHLARELNTLGAAAITQLFRDPLVLQTHGMLDAPGNRLAEVVDVVLTSRVLRRASNALTLTAAEDEEVERLSRGALRATRFPNGVEFSDSPSLGRDRRSVLFLARLHPRKGAVQFAEAAVGLASHRPDLRFDIVGPDEGDAAAVRAIAERARPGTVVYHGPVDHAAVGAFMDQAALYCLPAHDEPFGLSVLEALAAETPVLLHSSAQLAPEIVAAEAGWVFGNDEQGDDLEEVMGFALADPVELARRGRHARRLVEQRYGIEGVATRLAKVYQGVIAARTGRPGSSQYLRDELNEASS